MNSIDLPEISLEHVEFQEESWDFDNRAGMSASIKGGLESGDESLFRLAVGYLKYEVVRRPRYDEREVVFEVGDGSGRTVTQTVSVEIDPGEMRRLTAKELEAKRTDAREELILRLRRMVAVCRYLVPKPETGDQ